jgi:hypothetical protein
MTPQPPGTPVAFIPEFRTAFVTDSRTGATYPANSDYFATERTAQFIAEKYGDGAIFEEPFLGPGPFYTSAGMYMIRYTPEYPGNGDPPEPRRVNAGILAAYYKRNPESEFPGLAEKLIRSVLKNG